MLPGFLFYEFFRYVSFLSAFQIETSLTLSKVVSKSSKIMYKSQRYSNVYSTRVRRVDAASVRLETTLVLGGSITGFRCSIGCRRAPLRPCNKKKKVLRGGRKLLKMHKKSLHIFIIFFPRLRILID